VNITIPNTPTIEQAQSLRAIAERGSDPALYRMAAVAFRLLDMPAASEAMQRRAEHYEAAK